jgi:adenylosuccinate synthase
MVQAGGLADAMGIQIDAHREQQVNPVVHGLAVERQLHPAPVGRWQAAGDHVYEDFPQQLKDYIAFIEKETGCPVRIISVGPDREAIVVR